MTKFTVTTTATFTRKGVRVDLLRSPKGERTQKTVNGITYMHVQLHPVHPARFEWVREDNLITKTIAA